MILFYDSELFLQHLRHPAKLNLHKAQRVPGGNILFCNVNSLTQTGSFLVLLFFIITTTQAQTAKFLRAVRLCYHGQANAASGKILTPLGEAFYNSAGVIFTC